MKRIRAAVVVAGAVAAALLMLAEPAGASLSGPCEAKGTFTPAAGASGPATPFTVDAKTASGAIEVPDEASVAWEGRIGDGRETEPRATSGAVSVVLPPVVDSLFGGSAELYTWGGDDTTATAKAGTKTYDIPAIVPAGAKIVVSGAHTDTLGTCSGTVTLKLAGSALTEPVTIVMLVLTGGSAALMVLAGRPA